MKQPIFRKYKILLLIISGVVSALPLVIDELGFVQWLSIVPMALVLVDISKDGESKLRRIYLLGLLFFESYFLVVFHWFLSMYPLEFTGISKPAAIVVVAVAWIGLSMLESVVYALVFVAFALISRSKLMQREIVWSFIVPTVAAALWTVFEWIQTLFWWGVPWGRLCLGQTNAPLLLGSASVFGSYFVTFIIVLVNFLFACAILSKGMREKIYVACALGAFCLNLTIGLVVTATNKEVDRTLRVAAIQGNNPNSEGWTDQSFEKVMDTHERLTKKAANDGAELVLWSETAFPYTFHKTPDLSDRVSLLAQQTGVTILVSAFTESGDGDKLYVLLIEVKPDGTFGEVEYSKQRLVPFGEFVPMRELVVMLIPPLAELKTLENDLVAGSESTVLPTDVARIGAGICYDSIFEEEMRGAVSNGAELLVISTNDSWFGDSAALRMHNSQSVLRSIELGRYVVRSANTGISSIIAPNGRILQSLPPSVDGYVIDDVHLNTHNTLYALIGNAFVYVCLAFLVSLIIADIIKNVISIRADRKR